MIGALAGACALAIVACGLGWLRARLRAIARADERRDQMNLALLGAARPAGPTAPDATGAPTDPPERR